MGIFGNSYPKLVVSSSGQTINLEHVRFDYSFFNTDTVEHISTFTGKRHFLYNRNQSSFKLDINLCNYSSSEAKDKYNALYVNKNNAFLFYPHSDNTTGSVDVYGTPIQYYLTEFTPYYLDSDNDYDALIINLSPRKNSVLWPSNLSQGYGLTPYGGNYGF